MFPFFFFFSFGEILHYFETSFICIHTLLRIGLHCAAPVWFTNTDQPRRVSFRRGDTSAGPSYWFLNLPTSEWYSCLFGWTVIDGSVGERNGCIQWWNACGVQHECATCTWMQEAAFLHQNLSNTDWVPAPLCRAADCLVQWCEWHDSALYSHAWCVHYVATLKVILDLIIISPCGSLGSSAQLEYTVFKKAIMGKWWWHFLFFFGTYRCGSLTALLVRDDDWLSLAVWNECYL